jgi:hypothetical protein
MLTQAQLETNEQLNIKIEKLCDNALRFKKEGEQDAFESIMRVVHRLIKELKEV